MCLTGCDDSNQQRSSQGRGATQPVGGAQVLQCQPCPPCPGYDSRVAG